MEVLVSDALTLLPQVTMSSPTLNRGVGFTHKERRRLELTSLLPPVMLNLKQQADRVWIQVQSFATNLDRILLTQSHHRHKLFYCKVLADHLPELIPVVYTYRR